MEALQQAASLRFARNDGWDVECSFAVIASAAKLSTARQGSGQAGNRLDASATLD
jgi:hypothetical protein